MSKTPPIPKDQASHIGSLDHSPTDLKSDVKRDPSRDQSGLNLKERGASANLHQNVQHHVQDR